MLTSHCTSLELSLVLREAGYPQENALFYYVRAKLHTPKYWGLQYVDDVKRDYDDKNKYEIIASPLASELMEKMPEQVAELLDYGDYHWKPKMWCFWKKSGDAYEAEETLPDTLARLFLHLRQEQLI